MAQTSQAGAAAAANGADLEQAHRALRADPSLQFELEAVAPPDPPRQTPDWLTALFEILGPILQWVFWGGVFLLAALIVALIVREAIRRMPESVDPAADGADAPKPEFRPQHERARALLEEADRLAREGRYSEAARVLLHRSIEDLEAAFPSSIGIAMTSREIARIKPLSEQGRSVFSRIALAVETSLFGGAPLDAARYAECRAAYESFALGGRA